MTRLQALQAVQYVNVQNRRYVVMEAEDWEALLAWLETLEDLQVFRQAQNELETAGGDPVQAGWLRWEDIRYRAERMTGLEEYDLFTRTRISESSPVACASTGRNRGLDSG